MTRKPATTDELARLVPDGALLGIPPDYSGVSMAMTAALVRRGARGLRLLCLPYSTVQADVLIGVGAVAEVEAAAVTLGEQGLAPRFSRAVEAGDIVMRDSTCPAIHSALQAAEKGVPFMTLRGLIGSDILAHRPDWRVIDNPFEPGDRIVALPAIHPDVAVFHAAKADAEGNVWIGRRRELATLAHAARRTLVTVEEIVPGSFFESEPKAASALPAFYVDRIAVAPRGAWPCGVPGLYDADPEGLGEYASAAGSEAGFREWLARFLAGELGAVPA